MFLILCGTTFTKKHAKKKKKRKLHHREIPTDPHDYIVVRNIVK